MKSILAFLKTKYFKFSLTSLIFVLWVVWELLPPNRAGHHLRLLHHSKGKLDLLEEEKREKGQAQLSR